MGVPDNHDIYSVAPPKGLEGYFENAQAIVEEYFKGVVREPETGRISVSSERFLQLRAASFSTEFFDMVRSVFRDLSECEARSFACDFLFDIAHTIGREDCRHFKEITQLDDPLELLAVGPVYFAFSGWAKVQIFPNFNISFDENFYMEFEHINSFEADTWIQKNKKTNFPVCIMNAGYASGWAEEVTGVKLIAVETFCRAMGHASCQFVIAPPGRIGNYVAPVKLPQVKSKDYYFVPEFFHRKRLEDELRREKNFIATILDTVRAIVIVSDKDGRICRVNRAFEECFGYSEEEVRESSGWELFILPEDLNRLKVNYQHLLDGSVVNDECFIKTKDGRKRLISWVNSGLKSTYDNFVIATGIDITDKREAEIEKERLNEELRYAARMAGMADVASGVIHNVGNVLNSLNVSADSIWSRVHALDPAGIVKTIKLLEVQKSKGWEEDKMALLPEYLERYIKNAEMIKDSIVAEVERLTQNIQHINTIVSMQQNYTGVSGVEELVSAVDIMNVALEVNADSLYRKNITLRKNFDSVPDLCVDKHKVLQILLNLIQNAKQALGHEIITKKVLTATIECDQEHWVVFKIKDTGIGISEHNLKMLFQHGFTTRDDGHGFGLHISAMGARDLGGSLQGNSDGEGKGAEFVLRLPVSRHKASG